MLPYTAKRRSQRGMNLQHVATLSALPLPFEMTAHLSLRLGASERGANQQFGSRLQREGGRARGIGRDIRQRGRNARNVSTARQRSTARLSFRRASVRPCCRGARDSCTDSHKLPSPPSSLSAQSPKWKTGWREGGREGRERVVRPSLSPSPHTIALKSLYGNLSCI